MKIRVLSAFFLVLVCAQGMPVFAAGALSPKQGTQELLDVVAAKGAALELRGKVKEYFDYSQLVKKPIEPHRAKLSSKQMKRYSALFTELLKMAPFIAALNDEGGVEYSVAKPVKEKSDVRVAVQTYNPSTDMESSVAFVWRDGGKKSGWRIVDVQLDGASMVKGYQNQFGRILKKDGPEVLLKRLEDKLADVKAKQEAKKS